MNGGGTTDFRGMIGTMTTSTTIGIGQTLTLSLSGRYLESVDNGAGLRFGFVNSVDAGFAYGAQVGTGGNTGFGLIRDDGGPSNNQPGSGSDVAGVTGGNITSPAYTGMVTSTFEAMLPITRSATSTYIISAGMDGSIIITTDASGLGWESYDRIYMRNGNNHLSGFRVDDISVALIPEPRAVLLGGLGSLVVLGRRR